MALCHDKDFGVIPPGGPYGPRRPGGIPAIGGTIGWHTLGGYDGGIPTLGGGTPRRTCGGRGGIRYALAVTGGSMRPLRLLH